MTKILVFGSKGMLGTDLCHVLQVNGYEVYGVAHTECDIRSWDQVFSTIQHIQPDGIINCASYTQVDKAEEEKDQAFNVNAYGAEYIARGAKEYDIPVVQISTNYVFAGDQEEPYTESDIPHPMSIYGQSKLRGEELVQEYNSKHYIVRTSNLYGVHGKNFVQTMLRLAQERESLQVISDQIGNPTYTYDLAKAIEGLLADQAAYGIYHLTNRTPADAGISWYHFAKKIMENRGMPTKVVSIASEDFPQAAPRPRQGTLANTKCPHLRHYQDALDDFLAEHLSV